MSVIHTVRRGRGMGGDLRRVPTHEPNRTTRSTAGAETIDPALAIERAGRQAAEDRHAVRSDRAQLTIQIGGRHRQGTKGTDGDAIPMGPVEPGTGQQLSAAVFKPGVHAVAVMLDLVQPLVAGGRFLDQAGQLGLDPFGQCRCRRLKDPRGAFQHGPKHSAWPQTYGAIAEFGGTRKPAPRGRTGFGE